VSLTYQESSDLMNDFQFRGKIKTAALTLAAYWLNEAPDVVAHNSHYKWSQSCFQQPDMTAQGLHPPVVMDQGVQGAGLVDDPTTPGKKISAATDTQIQAAVQAVVEKII